MSASRYLLIDGLQDDFSHTWTGKASLGVGAPSVGYAGCGIGGLRRGPASQHQHRCPGGRWDVVLRGEAASEVDQVGDGDRLHPPPDVLTTAQGDQGPEPHGQLACRYGLREDLDGR